MSNNLIPELNEYQFKLLHDVGQAKMCAFILTLPSPGDSPERRQHLTDKGLEIKQLEDLGLVEDASKDFTEMIRHNTATSGSVVKVFAMTEVGFMMFRSCEERPIN